MDIGFKSLESMCLDIKVAESHDNLLRDTKPLSQVAAQFSVPIIGTGRSELLTFLLLFHFSKIIMIFVGMK